MNEYFSDKKVQKGLFDEFAYSSVIDKTPSGSFLSKSTDLSIYQKKSLWVELLHEDFYSLTSELYLVCYQSFHLGNSSFVEFDQTVGL